MAVTPRSLEKYNQVKALVEDRQMSITEACKELHLSTVTYQKIKRSETGEQLPLKTHILRKHAVIDMPLDQPEAKVTVIVCDAHQIKGVMENLR